MVYTRDEPRTPFARRRSRPDAARDVVAPLDLRRLARAASGRPAATCSRPALDGGMLIHYGERVPPVVIEDEDARTDAGAAACQVRAGRMSGRGRRGGQGRGRSRGDGTSRSLAAIRLDLPRPTVHARNLFHISAAMWDAWAGYDAKAKGVFVRERHTAGDVDAARRAAISYAAYDVLAHRYAPAIGGAEDARVLRARS